MMKEIFCFTYFIQLNVYVLFQVKTYNPQKSNNKLEKSG